jgi:hypothetical protein
MVTEESVKATGFERLFIKAAQPPDVRHALGCLLARHGGAEVDLVRDVVCLGLAALGWSEQRIIEEYAAYRVQCLQQGTTNAYGKE